ncbi:MAG: translocation/assembly module TamB domain-containing protein [Cyclobacteriaceae bacterium]|nr:translocation/assembly module TamB domain-containing protein [Cyclobacteriaceae bacterium]
MNHKFLSILKRISKILLWIIGSVIGLLIIVLLLLNIPSVQNMIVDKVGTELSRMTGTEISVERVGIFLPTVALHGIYIEGSDGDTLAYVGEMKITANLAPLLNRTISLENIRIADAEANISRPDSSENYNFQFILDSLSSGSTTQQSQSPWNFTIDEVSLENIHFVYHDYFMNQFGDVTIGGFDLDMDTFDLNELDFYAGELRLDNSRILYSQSGSGNSSAADTAADTTTQTGNEAGLDLKVADLVLSGNSIVFMDSTTRDLIELDIGNFNIREGAMHMKEQSIVVSSIALNESRLAYLKDSSAAIAVDQENPQNREPAGPVASSGGAAAGSPVQPQGSSDSPGASSAWSFRLDDLEFENNSISYHDERYPRKEQEMDMNHLEVELVNTLIGNIRFDSSLQADIHQIVVREKNGISIEDLKGSVYYSVNEVRVDDFHIETSNSFIDAGKIILKDYQDINSMNAEAELKGSLFTGDITYVLPSLEEFIAEPKIIDLKTSLVMEDQRVTLENLDLSAEGIALSAKGTFSGLEDLDGMNMEDVQVRLETSRGGLESVVPSRFLPDSLTLPDQLSLDLAVEGSMDDFSADVNFSSNLGAFAVHINQDSLPSGGFRMDSRIGLKKVQLGRILNDPRLGIADADISLSGNGMELMKAAYQLRGTINRFDYSGYAYEDIMMEASYDDPDLKINISADQPAIAFQLEGNAVLRDSFPSVAIHLNLEKADFDSLNLFNQQLVARAVIDADLDSIQTGRLNGSVGIRNVAFLKNGEVYEIDSLMVVSIDQEDNSELTIHSDLLTLQLQGNVPIMKIPTVVTGLMGEIMTPAEDSIKSDSAYHLNFNLELHRNELLSKLFIPQLKRLDIDKFEGELDESEDLIKLDIEVPVIEYGSFTINSFTAKVDTKSDRINGYLNIDELRGGDIAVSDILLNASAGEDRLMVNFEIPKADSAFLKVVSEVFRQEGILAVHILEDSLILNGNHWQVNPENRLLLGNNFHAENFELTHNDQRIRISQKQGSSNDSVTVIDINDFNLAAFGHIFDTEKPFFDGILNTDLTLGPRKTYPSGNIGIDSLAYQDIPLGNITANIENIESGMGLDFILSGESGSLSIQGAYLPEDNNRLDLNADFQDFSLQSLKPVTDPLSETFEGELDGQLSITGTTSSPGISGDLNLNNLRIFPEILNTWIYIDDETIHFDQDEISFNNFTIQDADKQEATLDGTVNTGNFKKVELDLSFEANDFLAFNSEEASGENIFYGKIIIDSDIQLSGSPAQLEITGGLVLNEKSDLNVIIPGANDAVIQRDKIVNFIDLDQGLQEDRFQMAIKEQAEDSIVQSIEGIEINLNIDIEENSRLKFIIDEQTNEYLAVQGQGDLSFQLQPNGGMNMSGRYDINEGVYFLNFQGLVKREFNIQPESYIEWTGQPTDAYLNIVAQYSLETQPPVTDITDRIPFNVVINIKGEIMSPDLSFSISMPEQTMQQYQQVAAYINDINGAESELNKQVMSLVLFKNFMTGQDAGSSGLGLTSTARASISKFLTQQLNRLSTGIEGFNVSFNLESYETQSEAEGTQGVTNLEVGLSQSLFSDRLTVKVSGDVYLEDNRQQSNEFLNYMDDVALEYQLTEDGNFHLVGFRENEYDGISQGEIIRTGVGIIFSNDYNDIRELFKKKKNK